MTTLEDVLKARLMGHLTDDSIRRIDDKTFVRLDVLRIRKDKVTVCAAGGLECVLPIQNFDATINSGGEVVITLPSAYIEATLK